jgi:DnaJ-class molecular chaperone
MKTTRTETDASPTETTCARCGGLGYLVPATVENEAQAIAMAPECPDCEGNGTVDANEQS